MQPPLVVLFDGTCGFCTRCIRWARERDAGRRLAPAANQAPGIIERYGLSRADVDRSVWVIDANGRRASGAVAVNEVLSALGGAYRVLSWLLAARPVTWLEERAYLWVAAHRQIWSRWWGDVPECDRTGSCA